MSYFAPKSAGRDVAAATPPEAANIDEVYVAMNRTASPLTHTAKVTVALLFIVWLVDYFDRLIMNFALPYIGKDFYLDHTQEGLLISAFFIAYAFSQLRGGVLFDQFGTRKQKLGKNELLRGDFATAEVVKIGADT